MEQGHLLTLINLVFQYFKKQVFLLCYFRAELDYTCEHIKGFKIILWNFYTSFERLQSLLSEISIHLECLTSGL